MTSHRVVLVFMTLVLILTPQAITAQNPLNPLTGLPADDPDDLNRRPLLIKISNFPPSIRPYQIGLNDAEIVWEHLLAGGVTRFSAVFLEGDYEKIGPIRSARLLDFQLTRIYEALFVYSGMAPGTLDVFFEDNVMIERGIGGSGPCPPLCRYPQDGLALEHTLYGDTAQLRTEYAAEREADLSPAPITGMVFRDATPRPGRPVQSTLVRYRRSLVQWQWDNTTGRWLRFQDGDPHMDTSSGEQISAANVVIIEAEHVEMPFVRDEYWGPPNYAFDVPLVGTGRVYLLRGGALFRGQWQRETQNAALTFLDARGDTLPFAPGNTFFNLVPMWTDGYELEFVPADPTFVTVNGDTGVNMQWGPNPQYVTPDVAYPGDEFILIGRNYDGNWLQVKRGDERAVWLPVERLSVNPDIIPQLPNPRPSHER